MSSRCASRGPDGSLVQELKYLTRDQDALWGEDRSRSSGSASVQALVGTAPVAFASGNYAKAHKRYACLKPVRNALHQFAWQSTLREGWALRYYQHKRAEGKSHSMALRVLANGWVRIVRHVGAYEIPAACGGG